MVLQGSRTVHSTFKVLLDNHRKDQPSCNIKEGTSLTRWGSKRKSISVTQSIILTKCCAAAIIEDKTPTLHHSTSSQHCQQTPPHCCEATSGRSAGGLQWHESKHHGDMPEEIPDHHNSHFIYNLNANPKKKIPLHESFRDNR